MGPTKNRLTPHLMNRIRQRQGHVGLSDSETADYIGVHITQYRKYLTGRVKSVQWKAWKGIQEFLGDAGRDPEPKKRAPKRPRPQEPRSETISPNGSKDTRDLEIALLKAENAALRSHLGLEVGR